jgi:multidrug resistance efflux pump
MPFAGNLRTLPLPDVFQTLNNIKATGVLRLRSNAGSRDVVFQQGEIIGVGFLDKAGREDLSLRLTLLAIDVDAGERLKGVTWYWTAMQAREHTARAELDELVHEQAREQLHNLFAWNQAEFAFDESGPGKDVANELVARSLERPLSIDTATILLEAAKQQDEWAELRSRIRDEAGMAAMGSSPSLSLQDENAEVPHSEDQDSQFHLYLDGEWRGPFPRSQIIGLVQIGEIAPETWSYDPRTQDRRTLDDLLGGEARRITPDELDTLRQAVKAAENRLAEERAGRAADLAELRGLSGEVLRLAHDCQLSDPAISTVVERLAEVVNGDDPSIVALASETVIVALVRHLRDLGTRELDEARGRADALAQRISALEHEAATERVAFEAQLMEAERRSDSERDATAELRQMLAAAAEDAAHLNQELERSRRDQSRASTARISAIRSPEDITASRAKESERSANLERELGRMRAEHARLLCDVATLQARIDEDRARHDSELEATRALAGSLETRLDPPTEKIGKATETLHQPTAAADSALVQEIERLKGLLAEAERRGSGSDVRRAVEERDRVAAERDMARGDTERLRRDLHAARSEAARAAELAHTAEAAESRIRAAEERAAQAEERLAASERRVHAAEEGLAEARQRYERAESALRDHERAAYEAARNNTELQVRIRELAARLEDGEARLNELGDLSAQLDEARAHAARLEDEGVRIRADLANIRDAATGRLDRAKRRVSELRARLRAAKRDRNAAVPWSSPMTAAFAAAPQQPHAQVPWPSPATATFTQQTWQPTASAAFQPQAGAALSPLAGQPELPNATLRTTSGTFVPMPMPEDSSAQRPRVQPMAEQPPAALPAPSARRWHPLLTWGLSSAAMLGLGIGLLWWGATAAVPICDRAIVNGQFREVVAPIAGQLQALQIHEGSWVNAGTVLGTLRNNELDPFAVNALRDRSRATQARILATESSQRQVQNQLDQVSKRLVDEPTSPEVPALTRLRDAFSTRVVELSATLDDLRTRLADIDRDTAAEEQRLAQLREATLVSPVDGLVWSIASSDAQPAGKTVFTLIESSSLIIDAEMPSGVRINEGDPAQVQLPSGVYRATVSKVAPGLSETSRLARTLSTSSGSQRVLLTVENQRALYQDLSQSARIAFVGTSSGLLNWLGRLRF